MELLSAYIPMDRRQALARGLNLPDRTHGAALFADISGFTPLTEALAKELGPKRGAEELTRQLNLIYDALIAEIHRYGGSVIGFAGDAVTCWFDGDDGRRATACGLEMQQTMGQIAAITTSSGRVVSLAMKAAVAAGPVRRFLVGDPHIQVMDVLAGATLDRMAEAEHYAEKGEVVIGPEVRARLGGLVEVARSVGPDGAGPAQTSPATSPQLAVVGRLTRRVETAPWPTLAPLAGQAEGWLDPLTETQLRPWLLPPVYERLRSGQGQFLAEIRPTVALFLHFGGIDYDEDEAAGVKLDAYLRWAQQVVTRRYEGYLLQVVIGDKGSYFYAAFGAPLAHDDDPARAVAAALELRAPPPDLNFIRGIQIGISRGRMWAGAYGGTMRRTYGILGDEVNFSARLMGKAEPGQILVSQDIAAAAAQDYQLKSIGRIQVKGKQDPQPVSLVLDRRRSALQRPFTMFTGPLVGREVELTQLEQVLERARAGEGQIVRLEGGPGIGKSHLAAELAERAQVQGWRAVLGACQSTSQDIAYTPWRHAFRTLFALVDESDEAAQPAAGHDGLPLAVEREIIQIETLVNQMNPGWVIRLPLLGDLLGVLIPDNATTAAFDPRLRQEALFTLAVDLIQSWAQSQPLLLLLEDVHWMDEASQAMTLALGRVIARMPAVLALVHRPPIREDSPLLPELNRLPNCRALDLNELSPEGIAGLVANRLQGQAAPLVLSLIQARAQGNPFFTEELVDTLREAGHLHLRDDDGSWVVSEIMLTALREANCLNKDTSGQWVLAPNAPLSAVAWGIPDSVHGVVLSRIDRLPDAPRVTLKVASVIGRIFEILVLAQSHPAQPEPEPLQEQIKLLEARDFSRLETPPPRLAYMFKHNVTQEVSYETLLEAQQRELHLAVALVLERLEPEAVEQLAYHFSRGGAEARDKALFYLDQAAHRAQGDYANETALNYYTQALALEERWEWRKGQVEVLHILGRREEELVGLRALEVAPGANVFDSAYLWGQYYEAIGDYTRAQAAVEHALAAAHDRGDAVGQGRCLSQLGLVARRHGDYERAKAWYGQALALFENEAEYSNEQAQVFAQAVNGLGIVHRQQGNFEDAGQRYEQALALSRGSGNRMGEAQALDNLGTVAFHQRKFAEATPYHQQALEIRRAIGDRAGEATSVYNLALACQEGGDYDQARRFLDEALTIQQATGNRWEEANIWNALGVLNQGLGDLPQAQTCLQQGLRLSEEIGDEAGQAYILCNLGLVARDRGNLDAAERLLADGLALAQAQADRVLISILLSYSGSVSLRAGRFDQAIEQASAALKLRQELDLRLQTTADLTTLAAAYLEARDISRALNFARQAFTILDECRGEGPEFPQQDYYICHKVLAAAGQAEPARLALQSARQLVITRAEKINDPVLRQSYLEQVPINREILGAADEAEPNSRSDPPGL